LVRPSPSLSVARHGALFALGEHGSLFVASFWFATPSLSLSVTEDSRTFAVPSPSVSMGLPPGASAPSFAPSPSVSGLPRSVPSASSCAFVRPSPSLSYARQAA
jgi:hypothetical protein